MRFHLAFVLLAACACSAQDFNKDLQPVFRENCFGCHAGGVNMGSLDLQSYSGIMKGGNNGVIVVPGKSQESRLYLMTAHKMKPAMPMDGRELAAGDLDVIRRWIDAGAKPPLTPESAPAAAPAVKPRVAPKPRIFAMAWSADGKRIAVGGFKEVRLLDNSGKQVATLSGELEAVRAVAFSSDGKLLAAAGGLPGQRGEVRIWNLETSQPVQTIAGHKDAIYAVAFSIDGKTLATGSYDKMIYLWDVSSGKQIRTLKDHIDAVYALAFTPDGKRLISAAADRTVKIWDPGTGERLYTLSESTDGVNSIALDPTGAHVAAGGLDKTIRIWELGEKAGKLKNTLIAHEDAILRLAWAPDGKTIATGSADRTIKLFRAGGLAELKTIPNQTDWISGLAFSPDSRRIFACRMDGTFQFYDVAN